MEAIDRSDKPGNTNRIHSLDAYRGVLMLLGIVLHSAIPFMHGGDDVSTGVVKFSFWSVHLFRMPAFFVLSGFFGALLWQRYGASGMLMNRFERLALPLMASLSVAIFVIFFPVLLIDRWFNHSGNILVDAFDQTMSEIIPLGDPGHLWFLYYLVVMTYQTIILRFLLILTITSLRVQVILVELLVLLMIVGVFNLLLSLIQMLVVIKLQLLYQHKLEHLRLDKLLSMIVI